MRSLARSVLALAACTPATPEYAPVDLSGVGFEFGAVRSAVWAEGASAREPRNRLWVTTAPDACDAIIAMERVYADTIEQWTELDEGRGYDVDCKTGRAYYRSLHRASDGLFDSGERTLNVHLFDAEGGTRPKDGTYEVHPSPPAPLFRGGPTRYRQDYYAAMADSIDCADGDDFKYPSDPHRYVEQFQFDTGTATVEFVDEDVLRVNVDAVVIGSGAQTGRVAFDIDFEHCAVEL